MLAPIRTLVMLITAFSLAACSANHNAIYRLKSLKDPSPSILTIDAKQRSILSAYKLMSADGTPDSKSVRVFCSEPSPDVFSVIAQSLSAGGSFGKSADPASIQAALNMAYSSSEQGSTIPRTQTVNMLRELMFRTCERYLSGGYSAEELSIQAIRDQRTMTSILAIEQLTGAVAPKPVVIGAVGNAASGVTGDAIVRVDDARKRRDSTAAAFATANDEFEQINGEDKVCDAIKDKPEADLSDDQKAKVKPCSDARLARDKASAEKASAAASYTELSTLAHSGGVSTGGSVSSTAPGGIDRAGGADVTAVAHAVENIVRLNFSDSSEVMMFCLKLMGRKPNDPNASALAKAADSYAAIDQTCLKFFDSTAALATMQNEDSVKKLNAEKSDSRANLPGFSDSNFTRFWTAERKVLFANAAARGDFVTWLRKRLTPRKKLTASEQVTLDCFRIAAGDEEVAGCFSRLPQAVQRDAIAH